MVLVRLGVGSWEWSDEIYITQNLLCDIVSTRHPELSVIYFRRRFSNFRANEGLKLLPLLPIVVQNRGIGESSRVLGFL
jgi:hypothetical protein